MSACLANVSFASSNVICTPKKLVEYSRDRDSDRRTSRKTRLRLRPGHRSSSLTTLQVYVVFKFNAFAEQGPAIEAHRDIRTGRPASRRTVRVTPPNIHSVTWVWPEAH